MLNPERLDSRNFVLYAARHYDCPGGCDPDEFREDMRRFKYLRKALTRYQLAGELRERLILNHLIILCNVFGPTHLARMLFVKLGDQMHLLRPFLEYLSVWPDVVANVGTEGATYSTSEIPADPAITLALLRL